MECRRCSFFSNISKIKWVLPILGKKHLINSSFETYLLPKAVKFICFHKWIFLDGIFGAPKWLSMWQCHIRQLVLKIERFQNTQIYMKITWIHMMPVVVHRNGHTFEKNECISLVEERFGNFHSRLASIMNVISITPF